MYVIGLTGGIGSGKSTAASIFSELGITVVNADQLARDVVEPGKPALDAIKERFGDDILSNDGSLDRRKLREIVFADKKQLAWLEQLTHPLIGELLIQQLQSATSPYAILESPLLLETRQKELVDRVLVVDLDESTQLLRTTERDGSSEETIKAIIAAQMPRNERLAAADDVVDNSQSQATAKRQILDLHEQYLGMANTS